MTKKLFEAVARVVAEHQEEAGHYTPETAETLRGVLNDLASDLADVFEGTNTLFDRERFLKAAGVPEDPDPEPPWGEQQAQVNWLESRYDD